MTSVNNVTNQQVYMQQLMGSNTINTGDGDGDHGMEAGSGQNKTNSFASSFQQALSQISGSNPASSSNNTQNAQAAIQLFVQQLLAALHQAGTGNAHKADNDGDGSAKGLSATSATSASGYGSVQTELQTLMQQVSSSSATNSRLQQSFQGMISALGASSGTSTNTLNSFLQSIAANLQGSSLVSTKA